MKQRTNEELNRAHGEIDAFVNEAYETMLVRESTYRGLWMDGGIESNLFHAKQKAVRLWRNYIDHGQALPESFMDDAIDMINYILFAMYCYKHGILKGDEDDGPAEPT